MAYERIAQAKPDIVLGGHGHAFVDPDGSILRDFILVAAQSEEALARLVPDRDLLRAMTPPGFDARRPPIVETYAR